jgi:hypothetical protein
MVHLPQPAHKISNLSLEPDPFREVLADRTLQEVVDKIFPWMRKKEDEEEKAFYAARGIKLKPEYQTVDLNEKKDKGGGANKGAVKGGLSSKVRDCSLAGRLIACMHHPFLTHLFFTLGIHNRHGQSTTRTIRTRKHNILASAKESNITYFRSFENH